MEPETGATVIPVMVTVFVPLAFVAMVTMPFLMVLLMLPAVFRRVSAVSHDGEVLPGFYEIPGLGTFAWRPGFEQSGVTPGVHRWPRDDVVFGPEAPEWHQGQVWVTDSAPAPAAVAAPGPWWTGGTALVGALAWKGGSTILSAFAKQ